MNDGKNGENVANVEMLPIPITNTNDNHLFEAEWGVGPTGEREHFAGPMEF